MTEIPIGFRQHHLADGLHAGNSLPTLEPWQSAVELTHDPTKATRRVRPEAARFERLADSPESAPARATVAGGAEAIVAGSRLALRGTYADPQERRREGMTAPEVSVAAKPTSRLVWISTHDLQPSRENEQLYSDTDATLNDFAEHLRRDGILEPLVVTRDGFIVSGHRRHAAALRAGLERVPCRKLRQKRSEFTDDAYVKLLREFNRQRSKTIDEILRESMVDANPEAAYVALVESRVKRARTNGHSFEIEGVKRRAEISKAKSPMLQAALAAIEQRREFWPLSVRQIHYCLLSDPPLRHAKKPGSLYRNDRQSYQDLCDLLARARIAGHLDWTTIVDETRPVCLWPTDQHVGAFVERELSDLFGNYWRDLQQSQPDHLEILIEKNASLSVIETVAMGYCIPITSGRGQTSKEKLWQIAKRFRASRKDRLVLLLLSDFDPDGDAIANANALSLRDDLGIHEDQLLPVRAALRLDQIEKYQLPQSLEAKTTSSNYDKFVLRHGVNYAVELEALAPEHLQTELDRSIRSHLDTDAFNREVEKEKAEAAKLQGLKGRVLEFIKQKEAPTN